LIHFLVSVIFFVNSRRLYLNKCCELKQRFLHVSKALTRPSLTMQLTSGMDVVVHVCAMRTRGGHFQQTVVTIFGHMTRDVSVFVKCDTIFRLFFVCGNYHKFQLLTIAR